MMKPLIFITLFFSFVFLSTASASDCTGSYCKVTQKCGAKYSGYTTYSGYKQKILSFEVESLEECQSIGKGLLGKEVPFRVMRRSQGQRFYQTVYLETLETQITYCSELQAQPIVETFETKKGFAKLFQ